MRCADAAFYATTLFIINFHHEWFVFMSFHAQKFTHSPHHQDTNPFIDFEELSNVRSRAPDVESVSNGDRDTQGAA